MVFLRYLPVSYTVHSRLKSLKELISWIYLFPFYGLVISYAFNEIFDWRTYLLALLCTISIYEIGYLFNDLKTSTREKNPTLRAGNLWYTENFLSLVVSRIVLCGVCMSLVHHIGGAADSAVFVLNLAVLAIAFYLHNTLRGRINTLTFSFLSLMKYAALLCLLRDPLVIIFTFFSFSFLRTIEYSAIKSHFGFLSVLKVESFDMFRVRYYLVVTLVLFAICFFSALNYFYMLIPLYFLIYRLLILMAGKKIRNY